MKTVLAILRHLPRLLLGLAMLAFGVMGLVAPMEPPPTLAPGALAFSHALQATGYMYPLIQATQILSGLLLLVPVTTTLGAILLAPFLVNAVLFHAVLERQGLVPSLVFAGLELIVACQTRKVWASLFSRP